jgi:hypothetical protein
VEDRNFRSDQIGSVCGDRFLVIEIHLASDFGLANRIWHIPTLEKVQEEEITLAVHKSQAIDAQAETSWPTLCSRDKPIDQASQSTAIGQPLVGPNPVLA